MSYINAITPAQWVALLVSFAAMITDLKWGKIFNWLTFPAILAGWLINFATGGIEGLAYSFGATLLGILIYMPAAGLGLMGMGDVKLLGAIGALGGSSFVVSVFLYSSALGIPHAIFIQFLNYGRNSFSMIVTSFSTKAFLEKTIHKENAHNQENKFRFLLGIDIFMATLIACIYTISLKY